MTPTITASLVRVRPGFESNAELAERNTEYAKQDPLYSVPFPERSIFISPKAQEYVPNVKITSNSIAEATATQAQLDAIARSLPRSIAAIEWPLSLFQAVDDENIIGVINQGRTSVRLLTDAEIAVKAYSRLDQAYDGPALALNDLA